MNNILKQKYLLILGTSFLLTACDKEKIALPGKREQLLILGNNTYECDSSTVVVLDKQKSLNSFEQVGENSQNLVSHHKLQDKLKKIFTTSVGSGEYLPSQIVGFDGIIYGIDSNGVVYSVKDKKVLWKYDTGSIGYSGGVCVDENNLFAVNGNCKVFCIDRKSGKKVWEFLAKASIRSAPVTANGNLYIQTVDNKIVALDQKTGKKNWAHSGISETVSFIGGSKPAITEHGDVLVAYSSGEVFLLNGDSGFVLWQDALSSPLRSDSIGSISHIKARPVIFGSRTLVISHSGKMVVYDLKTGDRQIEQSISGVRTPVIQNDFAFLIDSKNCLMCFNLKTNKINWQTKLSKDDIFAGPIIAGNSLILTSDKSKLVFVDPISGKIKKEVKYEGSSYLAPIVMNETLYLLTKDFYLHSWK